MLLSLLASAFAAPVTRPVEWTVGDTRFEGTLVWDDASTEKRPGIALVPNWMGVTPAAVEKAKVIAGDRYVVLVADVYGATVRPANPGEAMKAATSAYADRAALRARAAAAVEALRGADAPVDTDRLAAIGFCFGGATVLELARAGNTVVDAVVSFHGNLSTKLPAARGAVKVPVLALHGAADPYVPAKDVAAFQKEMTSAGADWQLVVYGGAAHCFAEPDAASPPGCVYDPKAGGRAMTAMEALFATVW